MFNRITKVFCTLSLFFFVAAQAEDTPPLCSVCQMPASYEDVYGETYTDRSYQYESFMIESYEGGGELELTKYWGTMNAVLERLPNISVDASDYYAYVLDEIVEYSTGHGALQLWELADNLDYCGLTGIPYEAGAFTLEWLSEHRPDVFANVQAMRDPNIDLKDELTYNVPFNLAVTAEYLWIVCPNLLEQFDDVDFRAKFYASAFREGDEEAYTGYKHFVENR